MRGILKHDIHSGIIEIMPKIVGFAIICALCGLSGITGAHTYDLIPFSYAELIAYIFKGCQPFSESAMQSAFMMPVIWTVIQVYMAYIIATYPVNDLERYGVNMIIRTKSKVKWWLGKVIWSIIMVIIMYTVLYSVLMIETLIAGGDFGVIKMEWSKLIDIDMSMLNMRQMIIALIVMPMATTIVVSLLQLMIMFLFNETLSYGVVGVLCVASAFYKSPLFLYSNTMAVRTTNLVLNGNYIWILLIMTVVAVISILCGSIILKRKNIYGNS